MFNAGRSLSGHKLTGIPSVLFADHRFRQITFLSACLRHMRFNKKTWVMHVDTDEFVVVNPLLRNTTQANVRMVKVGLIKDKSSVFDVIKQYQRDPKLRRKFNYPCISMPRLLFGSEEVTYNISMPHFAAKPPAFLNATNFETLRWKYHTFFNDVERNAQPKVIVDVSAVSSKDEMFSKPFSIHRPSKSICRRIDQLHFHQLQRYPITVNHYTGSWERYYLAKNDTRRSEKAYNFKAHVADGYDDWMPPWLDGFVLAIGENAAKELLHQYTTDKDKRKLPHANKGTSQQQSLPHDEVTASI